MEPTFHLLLYRAFHAQRSYLYPRLRELGLGPGQPKLLEYLGSHGPCAQRELAEYFEIDPAAVSRMLDTLQKGGFVARRTDGDHRRDRMELTEKGQAAREAWREACREMEDVMLRGFTREERESLARGLARVYDHLRTERGEGPWET